MLAYHGIVIHECWIVRESVNDEDKRDAGCSKQSEVDPWPEAKEREDPEHVYHFDFPARRISAESKQNFCYLICLISSTTMW